MIHGVKPPEQWLDFIEFMSGRPPVRLDTSGFYCVLFWIVFDPPGLLEWNKFQRGSTKSGHPRIMTLACVFLQTCPPPDFIWFQSWMTVWLCPLVLLDPLNLIFFSALLIFFGTVCWQIRQSCQSCEMSVLAKIREQEPLKSMIFHFILSACSGFWGLGPLISWFI